MFSLHVKSTQRQLRLRRQAAQWQGWPRRKVIVNNNNVKDMQREREKQASGVHLRLQAPGNIDCNGDHDATPAGAVLTLAASALAATVTTTWETPRPHTGRGLTRTSQRLHRYRAQPRARQMVAATTTATRRVARQFANWRWKGAARTTKPRRTSRPCAGRRSTTMVP